MPEPALKPIRRYAAFLSYRHADNREEGRRWAEWLHQALETYDVPRDLAGKPNVRGTPVPASLYPVFRDEEELPADADLSQNIRRALENSELLIVLCSPQARESSFVADEIRYFKELGRSARILALMIDGEPNADDPAKAAQGITPGMECFPEPLRYGAPMPGATQPDTSPVIDWTQRTEPLAADVRPGNLPAQGYTTAAAYRTALATAHTHSASEIRRLEKAFGEQLDLARLKIVAGALGVPLGRLRERDAVYRARRFRRLATILGSLALVALLAAGVAAWQRQQAVAAQSEANQQKGRAEAGESAAVAARERAVSSRKAADDLIAFMQYDLRKSLDKLGHLDLMENINGRIRRYHEEHPPESTDQTTQDAADRERSVALGQQGNILLARGEVAEALASDRKSLDIYRELATRDPANADRQHGLWEGLITLGRAQEAQSDTAAALASYQESLTIAQKLAAPDPNNADPQYDLAVSLNHVGDIQQVRGDLTAAQQNCLQAFGIFQKLAVFDPASVQWQHERSLSLTRIGDFAWARNDLPGALRSYRESLDIARKISAKDPSNAEWQRDVAFVLRQMAAVLEAQHHLDDALTNEEESLKICRQLAAQDFSNVEWKRELSICLGKIGVMLQAKGDPEGARKNCQESLDIVMMIMVHNPLGVQGRLDVARAQRDLGGIFLAQRNAAYARPHFETCLQILDWLATDHAGNYGVQVERAFARWKLSDCVDPQAPGSKTNARKLLVEAADLLHRLEKSPGLRPEHALWLKQIENGLSATD